jgi:hypothetical protein
MKDIQKATLDGEWFDEMREPIKTPHIGMRTVVESANKLAEWLPNMRFLYLWLMGEGDLLRDNYRVPSDKEVCNHVEVMLGQLDESVLEFRKNGQELSCWIALPSRCYRVEVEGYFANIAWAPIVESRLLRLERSLLTFFSGPLPIDHYNSQRQAHHHRGRSSQRFASWVVQSVKLAESSICDPIPHASRGGVVQSTGQHLKSAAPRRP